eukprot:364964-Chlamydomonas_euryale.AAC.6
MGDRAEADAGSTRQLVSSCSCGRGHTPSASTHPCHMPSLRLTARPPPPSFVPCPAVGCRSHLPLC